MKKRFFQITCYIIGVLGIAYISTMNLPQPASLIGVLFCIMLIGFAYVSTGKWGKYFTNEPEEGSFGQKSEDY